MGSTPLCEPTRRLFGGTFNFFRARTSHFRETPGTTAEIATSPNVSRLRKRHAASLRLSLLQRGTRRPQQSILHIR